MYVGILSLTTSFSMTDQQLIYALALQHVPKIGATTAKKLINHCGSAEAVLKEKKSKILISK